MPPLWICLATSWLRSNVAILALLPASAVAFCAARATSPASVTTSVIDGSCCSLAPMVCCTDGRSVPLTLMFSVLGSVFFTPAHRASSWTCPCSWMTQSVWLFGVAWTIFCPTVCPARSSSEPKYIRAPYCLYWSKPALNATTGIPAVAAAWAAGPMASGEGSVVAMPSTLLSTAFWIRVACLPASGSLEYFSVTLRFLAAASAPLRILSQNVSPGDSCVTIAVVYSCPGPRVFGAPPGRWRPGRAPPRTATTASVRSDLREPIFIDLSPSLGSLPGGDCVVLLKRVVLRRPWAGSGRVLVRGGE